MKHIFFTITFAMISIYATAQTFVNGTQGFPQPSVSNATTYGNIPVGLYTGSVDVSIPLYELQLKDIQLPIKLNYHTQNVKPNNLPSEVGLGWNLECGGYITRVIRNLPDTTYNNNINGTGYPRYRIDMTEERLINETFTILNTSSHGSTSYPHNSPDEFHFNFLGYSGYFIYDIQKGRWMVQSDSEIRVEYTQIPYYQIRSQVSLPTAQFYKYLQSQGRYYGYNPLGLPEIESFTLTTPDGYKYTFGGTYKTDYNISFKSIDGYAHAMTWHLSKIITPNKHEVEFKYTTMPLLINGNMSFNIVAGTIYKWNSIYYDYDLLMGVQLSEITDNTKFVTLASFQYTPSTQLKYGSEYAWLTADDYSPVSYFTKQKDFVQDQLGSLSILGKINYAFSYTKNSNERLKLKEITRTDQANHIQNHSFSYYPNKLPGYNTGHYDNFGFYNGKDFSYYFTNAFFIAARKADTQYSEGIKYTNSRLGDRSGEFVTAEMLKTITYPTRGYTEFFYEPNTASQMVTVNRQNLQPTRLQYPGTPDYTYPGGIRIKQVDNYNNTGEFVNRKHYYYTTNFTPENRNGATSGILSFIPQYVWGLELYNLYSSIQIMPEYESYKLFTSQGSNPLWYNVKGEYIGYSKVIECNEDKNGNLIDGYTIHTFSNFGPGYMDENPIAMLNNEYTKGSGKPINTTPYGPFTPCTSNSLKRGLLTSKESYDNNGIIKQKELYQYTPVAKDSILLTDLMLSSVIDYNPENVTLGVERHAFGGTFYRKAYSNLISEEQTFVYDDQGNALSYKNKYKYNDSNKMIAQKTQEDGNGNVYEERTKYITDMPIFANPIIYNLFIWMKGLNFVSYPMEITKIKTTMSSLTKRTSTHMIKKEATY